MLKWNSKIKLKHLWLGRRDSVSLESLSRFSKENIGAWPSGKAPGFGPGIRGFESLRPSHFCRS